MRSGMTTIAARMAAAAAAAVLLMAAPWFAVPATAQDSSAPAGEPGVDAGAAEEANDATVGEAGDDAEDAADDLTEEEERLSDLVGADEEGASGDYQQEEDDDFVPTQEVSSDQSVNFPVDI